jgi:hypothetical protein
MGSGLETAEAPTGFGAGLAFEEVEERGEEGEGELPTNRPPVREVGVVEVLRRFSSTLLRGEAVMGEEEVVPDLGEGTGLEGAALGWALAALGLGLGLEAADEEEEEEDSAPERSTAPKKPLS